MLRSRFLHCLFLLFISPFFPAVRSGWVSSSLVRSCTVSGAGEFNYQSFGHCWCFLPTQFINNKTKTLTRSALVPFTSVHSRWACLLFSHYWVVVSCYTQDRCSKVIFDRCWLFCFHFTYGWWPAVSGLVVGFLWAAIRSCWLHSKTKTRK